MSPIISSLPSSFGNLTTYPKIVTNGLVLHLDAGQQSSYNGGTTWRDLSGLGNNGTLVNGVGYSSANGGSLTFNGSNQYVTLSNLQVLTQITVSAWVKTNNIVNEQMVFSTGSSSSSRIQFEFWTSKLNFQVNAFNSGNYGNTTFLSSTWYNIVAVYDISNLIRIYYVNSKFDGNLTENESLPSASFSIGAIGRDTSSSSYYFNGNISQVSIYKRALTASEIQQNFQALRGRFGI